MTENGPTKKSDVASFVELRHFHVIVEFWVILKVTEELLPLAGTEPVPVQPMHVQMTHPSVTGLVTLQVMYTPLVYMWVPTLGVGQS